MTSASNETICEVNGELLNEQSFQGETYLEGQVASFPTVQVTSESLRRSVLTTESAQSAFLEHDETFWQRIQSAWLGHGIIGALSEVCSNDHDDTVPSLVKKTCKFMLVSYRWLSGMQFTFFPHLKLSNDQLIDTFSENANWLESPVRYLAWHYKANKFALALRDDTVRIHYPDSETVPMLKHKLQRNITALQWKPLSASVLAVGTQTAVLIWTIDPLSLSTRPSTGAVQVLSYSGHCPVTSLSWSPYGFDQLFTCSALSSAIVVWNVSQREHQVIHHLTGCGGVSRLVFSPDGSKVLAITPSKSFRIFETATWSNERWSNLTSRVQCASWNPSGTMLLFSMAGDPRLYSLMCGDCTEIESPRVEGASNAVSLFDARQVGDEDSDEKRNYIQSMCWDETGERLAIIFHKDDRRRHMVALYAISPLPVFSATPRGFIKGEPDSIPTFITFKPNFDKGACLTICYSTGRVSYIPLYFKHGKQQTIQSPLSRPTHQPTTSGTNLWSSTLDASALTSPQRA